MTNSLPATIYPLSKSFTAETASASSLERGQKLQLNVLFLRVIEHDDYKAFEDIFKNSYYSLCNFSNKLVHSRELAEEVVDDVFYNLWKNRKKIQINTSFKSYLLTAVKNRSLDYLRKLKKERNLAIENAAGIACNQSIASETMAFEELSRKIEKAIQALPKQCKLIFLLSRDQELKYKEIAEMLNISIKTVDTQMGRALKHLRQNVLPG
jgi:RNA polymerase sigma-70 factor (family 1)